MLLTLPYEIVVQISTFLPSKSLTNLHRANRLLSSLTQPVLTHHILTHRDSRETVLHLAAQLGNLSMLKAGLRAGIPIDYNFPPPGDSHNFYFRTALHIACIFASTAEHEAIIDYLIAGGADINARDHKAETPLHKAAQNGHLHIARKLLAQGVDPNAVSTSVPGGTALCLAASDPEGLPIVQALLSSGADPNLASARGEGPLHAAATAGAARVLRYLLEVVGMDPNVRPRVGKHLGVAPLHMAAMAVDDTGLECARVLLENGAEVDARAEEEGWTPIQLAREEGNAKVVELLLGFGAVEGERNVLGETIRARNRG